MIKNWTLEELTEKATEHYWGEEASDIIMLLLDLVQQGLQATNDVKILLDGLEEAGITKDGRIQNGGLEIVRKV